MNDKTLTRKEVIQRNKKARRVFALIDELMNLYSETALLQHELISLLMDLLERKITKSESDKPQAKTEEPSYRC